MSSGDPVLGIDLGASKVCVGAVDTGGMLRLLTDHHGRGIIPAVVSFDEENNVLVGEDALARRASDPQNTIACDLRPGVAPVVTRAGELAPADVAAILLDHVRRLADSALRVDTRVAVLTLPESVDQEQRARTYQIAAAAGLDVQGVISCPLAAAHAYGLGAHRSEFVAVCDFGASKFECAVLGIEKGIPQLLSAACDFDLGGERLNERIAGWMAESFQTIFEFDVRGDRYAMERFRSAAEWSKRQLSMAGDYGVQVEIPAVTYFSNGKPLDLQLLLTWQTFDDRTSDLLERALLTCDEALHRASLPRDRLSQVLLVGGSCRVPAVRERLTSYFGRTPRMDVDPEAACALGAALYAAKQDVLSDRITSPYGQVSPPPDEEAAPPVVRPRKTRVGRVVTKKMFTAVMDAQSPTVPEVSFSPPRPQLVEVTASPLKLSTVGGFCEEIIPVNEQVPATKTRVFSTAKDNQLEVNVRVCQGESRQFHENIPLGTLVLADLAPRPRGQVTIAVQFAIDDDGVLEASARDEQTGQAQSIRIKLPK